MIKNLLSAFAFTPFTLVFWKNLFFNFGVLYVAQHVSIKIGWCYAFKAFTPDQIIALTYLYTVSQNDRTKYASCSTTD